MTDYESDKAIPGSIPRSVKDQSQTMTQEKIERLHDFVEDTRETAEKVESGGYVNQDHAEGVAIGLRWAADELESVLNDDEAQESTRDL